MCELMASRVAIALRALAVMTATFVSVIAMADYPKPAPVPYLWELEFDAGPLRLYIDRESGNGYWYFTYTVTNRTGSDRLWAPRFTLFTDTGEIMDSGRNVPSRVTQGVLEMLGNELMQEQNDIIGDILQGRENAKEGVVLWPAKRVDVNQLSLFIAGLSGETARVKSSANGQEIILRKTLQRDYLIPGNAVDRGSEPVDLVTETWVLR